MDDETERVKVRGLNLIIDGVNVDVKEGVATDGTPVRVLNIGPIMLTLQLPLSHPGAAEVASMLLGSKKIHVEGADFLSKLDKPT